MKRFASRLSPTLLVVLATAIVPVSPASPDTVTTKNGVVYKGAVDKDNTVVSIFNQDGLKRVILRESKIARIDGDAASPAAETFAIVQPLIVHAGEMPPAAVKIQASPWDQFGRRTFSYIGPRGGKPVEMTQAIISLGPHVCKIRGVDGFWVAQVDTRTVPKGAILDILAKVDPKNLNERLRVCRFLIQAEWYTEARVAVGRFRKDFADDPGLADKAKNALEVIQDAEARLLLDEIEKRRGQAQQPRAVLSKLRSFPTEDAPSDVVATVKDMIRKDERREMADKALADSLRKAADSAKFRDKAPLIEILAGLAEAPDATRGRLEAFEKGLAEGAKPEALFALALSGWIAGVESAVNTLQDASTLLEARDLARDYLVSPSAASSIREQKLASILSLRVGDQPLTIAKLTEIVRLMPPPLANEQQVTPGKPGVLRVRDDPNPDQPTEYALLLPPEYSPLRSYPLVVALHGDETPVETLSWWAAEAAKRGYLVIAPEYGLRDRKKEYRFTSSEGAAVELAIRDTLKRFAVDPDRVFLGGSLQGGDMAWDFGLAHPDHFAGVAVVSGQPAKYVWPNKGNIATVPFYIAEGDLAPGETDFFFDGWARPLIVSNHDLTYVEYYRRGLEDLPEEAPAIFDWMDPRRRDPFPKSFEVKAGREGDDRFYGMVIQEFAPGRAKDPAGVDVLGKTIRPATIEMKARTLANLLDLDTSGVQKLEVWISPKLIDFEKRMELRINNKSMFRAMPKPDFGAFLDDVRVRGDRSQVFWMKLSGDVGGRG